METKTCKICGRELPEHDFPLNRYGGRVGVCKDCRAAATRETKARNRAQMGGGEAVPFSDPDFDGKTPGEVWRLMCRAEKWLNSREGYLISLEGEYHETKIRKLKKE